MLSSKGEVGAQLSDAACCFSSMISVSGGESEEGRKAEGRQPQLGSATCRSLLYLSTLSHCGRRKQNWFLLPAGSCLTRPTEHWFDFHFAAF